MHAEQERRGTLVAFLVLLLSLEASARSLPFFTTQDLTPFWNGEGALPMATAATLPTFQLVDQNNEPVSERNFMGRISLVNFFLCQCSRLCPLMMSELKRFLAANAARPPQLFSISVTPEQDTPKSLLSYARSRNIDETHWKLLTGNRSVIDHLGKDILHANQSDGQESNSSFIHSSSVFLVDGKLHIRGIYDTQNRAQMALLPKDIEQLRSEENILAIH